MSTKRADIVEINGVLVEGTHDAIIELRNTYGGRHANHLLVHVGEALVEKYPLLLSDMHATPSSPSQKTIPIKIKIGVDAYPRLSDCYRSIGRGLRGVAMINLLNRLYVIGENDPQQVETVVNERRREAAAISRGIPPAPPATTPPGVQLVAEATGSPGGAEDYDKNRWHTLEAGSPGEVVTEEITLTDLPVLSQDSSDATEPGAGLLTAEDDPLNGMGYLLID